MINLTNNEFIDAIFREDAAWCHVTDFTHDPVNIPKDQHLISWKGDYFSRYRFQSNSNQYFTISAFYADEQGQARRRKALFRFTPCIVLDDVKEKLSMVEVSKLPAPSWILESSEGSEQWGYILNTPCTDRAKVENLLDGLVANGLAPEGKDPGMKGVTRYLRLPEGVNNKASKLVNGQPFKCRMLKWEPFTTVEIEQLAAPFAVDLDAVRRESRVDGAADIGDHPLVNIPDVIHIKEVRSDGRFDITCPWVGGHTDADDSGSAIFTNKDGSMGFKCHHGSCQHRTGVDVLRFIEVVTPGFSSTLKNWQVMRSFGAEVSFITPVEEISFLDPPPVAPATTPIATPVIDVIAHLCDELRRQVPGTAEARAMAAVILKHVDDMPKMEQKHWHEQACDIMRWSKADFKDILKDLRQTWYAQSVSASDFYDNVVYVKELNQFYDFKSRIFFTTDAFQNSYAHEDAEARKIALQGGRVKKVDRLDYAPRQPCVFVERGVTFGNMWSDDDQSKGVSGDVTRWKDHFAALGWEEHRHHVEQWMAYTLRYPEHKINHMLVMGSGEGCGKDYLLYPLIRGMGENCEVIEGEELLEGFNDYLLTAKYLHVNETELGDHREAMKVTNKLKPIAAAPPERVRVNQKNIKKIRVRNIINGTMTTNSQLPMRLTGPSRRFYCMWSDMNPRDQSGSMSKEWLTYWSDRWDWMKAGGWENVVHYLLHEVSLQGFDPSEAPPMTEFLREIQDSSKSPLHQTIEAFIGNKLGMFQCDLVTAKDMTDTIRTDGVFNSADVYVDTKYVTPMTIGRAMAAVQNTVKMRGMTHGSSIRIYAIRNIEKYKAMGPSMLHHEYERQLNVARSNTAMTVVK